MFSPTVRSVREGMLAQVLELQSVSQPGDNELEITDPSALTGDDEDVFYELLELEESYENYYSARFKPSAVTFVLSELLVLSANDRHSILSALSPGDPETQHVLYRLRGLQSILPQIRSIKCSHPGLLAQRDDLITVINIEINQMLSELWREREIQTSVSATLSAHGIRKVDAGNELLYPYSSPLVSSVIILTAVIHAIMGVARSHCNFILSSLRALVTMASKGLDGRPANHIQHQLKDIPTTLPTALHRLNLAPKLDMYACCTECSTLYPLGGNEVPPTPAICEAQNIEGTICGATLSKTHHRGARLWRKPISRYSHMRFETWVTELVQRAGAEDLLESGRPNPHPGTIATDVWDAPYMRDFLKSANPTFMNPPAGDLSLVMMLHFDFFNPFTNKTSGKVRSVGCFFMVCLNLPPDVRYNVSNAYLVSMVPGPKEVKAEHLHAFIKPIVDDMLEMFSPGIWVSKTHKYPRGRRVRAAIAIKSMDIPAARGSGGFASHGHTCCCHLCNAKRNAIDRPSLLSFQPRTVEAHRQIVDLWVNAPSLAERQRVFDTYGVRYIDWVRFRWWDPACIVVGPMHWMKNVIEKLLRKNLNWSWDLPAGIPDNRPNRIDPITTLEYDWGTCAFLSLGEEDFKKSKLTAPIVRYLCRQRGIHDVGFGSDRLVEDLNKWRKEHQILSADGRITEFARKLCGENLPGISVTAARAHVYVTKPLATVTSVTGGCNKDDLVHLCQKLGLPDSGPKAELASRLLAHYENVRIHDMPDINTSGRRTTAYSFLGKEVLAEVKADMMRTILPSWMKTPPLNFATTSHGKLQAEELKSLVLVSFTITLVRLWGQPNTAPEFSSRLENFLHLMIPIRVISFQSISDSDIDAFDLHYKRHMEELKVLYPSCSIVPVHHLGLHIPQFLRSLGPSTRWSESTCEQFIGMFQDISTNFKFGDLEPTLHREFVMASRLKGLIEQSDITNSLEDFGQVIAEFLRQHIPNLSKNVWEINRSRETLSELNPIYGLLLDWASARGVPVRSKNIHICTSIRCGNVVYAPYTAAIGNSCVMFSSETNEQLLPGRIENILEESEIYDSNNEPRIVLVVRPFCPLSPSDSLRDPYLNNPIIGRSGAHLAQLFYNVSSDGVQLIEPRDIVSHVIICQYVDPNPPDQRVSRDCIVVLSSDLKHKRYC